MKAGTLWAVRAGVALAAAGMLGCPRPEPVPLTPPTAACPDWDPICHGPVDDDGDGHVAERDCDDQNPLAFPGAPDAPDDGVDQDCDELDGVGERPTLFYVHDVGAASAGHRMRAADVDGDGCDDLVLTAPDTVPGVVAGRGTDVEGIPEVLVFLGCDGTPATPDARYPDERWMGAELAIWPRTDGDAIIVSTPWSVPQYLEGRAVVLEWDAGSLVPTLRFIGESQHDLDLIEVVSDGESHDLVIGQNNEDDGVSALRTFPLGDLSGSAEVAPATGHLLRSMEWLSITLGASPDRDGDGAQEVLVHGPFGDDGYEARVLSHRPGEPTLTERWVNRSGWEHLGWNLRPVRGISNAGAPDLFVRGMRQGEPSVGWIVPPVTGDGSLRFVEDHAVLTLTGAIPDAQLGYQILTHDLDADGHADLIVTSRDRLHIQMQTHGQIHVFLGPITATSLHVDDADRSFTGDRMGDVLGMQLALADLDGDGTRELYASAPFVDTEAGENAGAIYRVDW